MALRDQSTATFGVPNRRGMRAASREIPWGRKRRRAFHAATCRARAEPLHGARQSDIDGSRIEAQFAAGLFVAHPHFLFGHADRIDGYARRPARQLRPSRAEHARRIRHGIGNLRGGRFAAGDFGQLEQNLPPASDSPLPGYSARPRGRARTPASDPRAQSRTSTTFRPVSMKAGMAPAMKSSDDLAGGRGLHIVVAHGRGGIDDHHRQSAASIFERDLLRHELRALIIAGHFRRGDLRRPSSPSPSCGMPMQPTVLV